jgi:SAM-dependent methyltransferase
MIARAAAGVRRRVEWRRRRGDAVRCPICERGWDRFKDDWNRPDALCWRCGSHERHRAQWLLFERRPHLLAGAGRLLHFAPEWCLRRRLSRHGGFEYVTADLDPAGVDLRLDVTRLDLPDGAFDAVVCSHVLEHVPDDAAAMRELRRVTRPGGWCLVLVPLDVERATTYEDPAVTNPEDRLREFRQPDHVRLYAPDVEQRLRAAGFAVEAIRPAAEFGEEAARRARLLPSDWLFLCR